MPGVDGADAVAGLEQRVEQVVVVHARQRVDRLDAVGDSAATVASAVVMRSAVIGSPCGSGCVGSGMQLEPACAGGHSEQIARWLSRPGDGG